jgi:hypothetical protein
MDEGAISLAQLFRRHALPGILREPIQHVGAPACRVPAQPHVRGQHHAGRYEQYVRDAAPSHEDAGQRGTAGEGGHQRDVARHAGDGARAARVKSGPSPADTHAQCDHRTEGCKHSQAADSVHTPGERGAGKYDGGDQREEQPKHRGRRPAPHCAGRSLRHEQDKQRRRQSGTGSRTGRVQSSGGVVQKGHGHGPDSQRRECPKGYGLPPAAG